MATRLRLSESVSAAVSPTAQTYTHDQAVRRKLSRSDSSTLTTGAYAPDGADHLVAGDSHHTQFVSDPMAAGNVFTSGDTLKYAVQVLESNAGNNLTVQLFVSVVSQDGTTVQATIRSKTTGGTEMATSLTNRFRSTTLSASYTTVAGDRLVVEFSGTGTPTAAGGVQGHNWSLRRGNSGAGGDLAENETDTGTTLNPWIEFTTTIAWDDKVVTPGVLSLTTSTFAPTVTATDNQLVTPDVVALTLTTFAPTVSTPVVATPDLVALTLTTFAPMVTVGGGGVTVTPDTLALSTATFAPTVSVSDNQLVVPGPLALSLSTFAPTVTATQNQTVVPGPLGLTLTGYPPIVTGSMPPPGAGGWLGEPRRIHVLPSDDDEVVDFPFEVF